MPAVVACAYKPVVGTGKNVGEVGRDVGVAIELDVAVVLRLAADSREAGRRMPVPAVLGLLEAIGGDDVDATG